jgi:hypothetical protein
MYKKYRLESSLSKIEDMFNSGFTDEIFYAT